MNRTSSMHSQPPSQGVVKNRFITPMSMLLIAVSLYVTCYMLPFRTVEVDAIKDAGIECKGEDGSASARVTNQNQNCNQRIQEFMDSITYEMKPAKELKNGDELTIAARYDETLASRYHMSPIQTVHRVKMKDLPRWLADVNEISASFLSTLGDRTGNYLNRNMEQILNEDFTLFSIHSQPELVNQKQVYCVSLDGKKSSARDKIIDIYTITAKGEVNTSSKKETLEMEEDIIYYIIAYNEIDISLRILDENVYREKLIISESNDLTKEAQSTGFIKSKYKSAYEVQIMRSEANSRCAEYGLYREV